MHTYTLPGYIAAIVYIFCNTFCYGFSALYHVGKWSVKYEILLQKLDHCGIALLSLGTFFPACILLLNVKIGLLFFLTTLFICIWTIYNIINSKPSGLRQILVIATLLPFMPWLYPRMNAIEFRGTCLTIVFQAIGSYMCDFFGVLFLVFCCFFYFFLCFFLCLHIFMCTCTPLHMDI